MKVEQLLANSNYKISYLSQGIHNNIWYYGKVIPYKNKHIELVITSDKKTYLIPVIVIYIIIVFFNLKNKQKYNNFSYMTTPYLKQIDLKFGYYSFFFVTIVFSDKVKIGTQYNWWFIAIILILFIWALVSINYENKK